jgi:glutamyl-tRNA reductase
VLHALIDYFFKGRDKISFFPNDFYHYSGREAITHLFRTASSLESLVVGEAQITGQIKQATEEAEGAGLSGPVLAGIIREALNVAKKVRRETSLGNGSVSMASLAAREMRCYLDDNSRPLIALIGSGPMTSKMAKHIIECLSGDLLFVNRTVEKAEHLARLFGGKAM